jgi:uncharacterized membrane protein
MLFLVGSSSIFISFLSHYLSFLPIGSTFCVTDPFHCHTFDKDHHHRNDNSILRIRIILGELIAIALALLVATDIIDTVLKPSHAYDLLDVVKMGFVTVLRTGLAYFLAMEMKEIEENKHTTKGRSRRRSNNLNANKSDRFQSGKSRRRTDDDNSSQEVEQPPLRMRLLSNEEVFDVFRESKVRNHEVSSSQDGDVYESSSSNASGRDKGVHRKAKEKVGKVKSQ